MAGMNASDIVEAPSWSIRPELPIDLDQIHELHRQAFPGPAEAELVDAIRAGAGFLPELSLVAVAADGSVLGHILISVVGFELDPAGSAQVQALVLAPLAVMPPHAGRGIGSALIRAALAVADQREDAVIAVLGAPSLFGRFGFNPAAVLSVGSSVDSTGPAFQVRSVGGRPIEPGTVMYPPMFKVTSP